jgi:hypothetical protein
VAVAAVAPVRPLVVAAVAHLQQVPLPVVDVVVMVQQADAEAEPAHAGVLAAVRPQLRPVLERLPTVFS